MTLDEFNRFCAGLPATSHVVQWRGADVWKVGGKVFAIARSDEGELAVTFKVGELSYAILKEQPGLRPAPYMASRSMTWIQHYAAPGLTDDELRSYLTQSHRLVAAGLTRSARRDLGLDDPQT